MRPLSGLQLLLKIAGARCLWELQLVTRDGCGGTRLDFGVPPRGSGGPGAEAQHGAKEMCIESALNECTAVPFAFSFELTKVAPVGGVGQDISSIGECPNPVH